MRLFGELGALVESRWRDHNYDEKLFPRIAGEALSAVNVIDEVDPWEIIRWVHSSPDLPQQMDLQGRFGNPPITLYVGPRFYIDAYYWLDGTTSIHQHGFSGAFEVLLGSSVHSKYRFEKDQEINPHFLVGKILLDDVSLLGRGDIVEIDPGTDLIHSLFHLERPSVTITARTHRAPQDGVQYSFFKPCIAIDPFFEDATMIKRTQTVSLLLRMRHPQADKFIGELIDASDFHTAYAVLKKAFDFLCHRELEEIFGVSRSYDRFQGLLVRARSRHGSLADLLPPVFEEEWRQEEIARRRSEIKGEDHRFFLALLMNVTDKATILRLVSQRFPGQDVVDLIVSWVKELSTTKVFGSREPNVLGIGDFNEIHLVVFKALLEGLSVEAIKARAASEAWTRSSMPGTSVYDLATHIQQLPLFRPIFASQ